MSVIYEDYKTIVGRELPKKFNTPEEQGAAIKKCSILEDTNINYGNISYENIKCNQ
ncbi:MULTISPECIES: hypothetical protein [unclassified Megasphaera]|uniref:hypothetical protein n=1 Tax=unclassified Megasphaera TaxID=2626256 RepID=UPI0025B9B3A5|nr:hypothetical protein [Megasphaera sp. UBA4233]